MLKRLKLERFKGFKEAELLLSPFTLLIGVNASGKSNICDALRFLHGISRGYSVAEIIGEKWSEAGILQWRGIRGGTKEIAFQQANTFALEVELEIKEMPQLKRFRAKRSFDEVVTYRIEVEVGHYDKPSRVIAEKLTTAEKVLFDVSEESVLGELDRFRNFFPWFPTLSFWPKIFIGGPLALVSIEVVDFFGSFRFLDFSPDAMRRPSFPGQDILGDRGENLSSVLYNICEDENRKKILIDWVRELTPMDAVDFEFVFDQTGKVLVTLVEENGQRTSAYSASDGTLRFLATIAALLGTRPARFYFFEELENGIHPSRMHLMLELIEKQATQKNIQIVSTTHSPEILRLASRETRNNASLLYRLPNHPDSRIKRIQDIAEIDKVLEKQNLGDLHYSGWFEDVVYFLED